MNRTQEIANNAYGDDLIAQYAAHPGEDHGDTLAEFLALELKDVVSVYEALRRVSIARRELESVEAALDATTSPVT